MFDFLPCRAKSTINSYPQTVSPSSSRSSSCHLHSTNMHCASSCRSKTIGLWIGQRHGKGIGWVLELHDWGYWCRCCEDGSKGCSVLKVDVMTGIGVVLGLVTWLHYRRPGNVVRRASIDFVKRTIGPFQWREMSTTEPRGSQNQGEVWRKAYFPCDDWRFLVDMTPWQLCIHLECLEERVF